VDGDATKGVGEAYVSQTRTPIKPIKMPDTEEYHDISTTYVNQAGSDVSSSTLPEPEPRKSLEQPPDAAPAGKHVALNLLIAEDDPINMTILRKRLERTGHKVFHAVNGEECAAKFGETSDAFDVILMDMQVSSDNQNGPPGNHVHHEPILTSCTSDANRRRPDQHQNDQGQGKQVTASIIALGS
jgi:hypothetical protein